MRILIVEDEVIPAKYIEKILLKEGYEVIGIANEGARAIEIAKREKPDIILMDIMLKDNISGAEASKEIYFIDNEIIIIFLTAFSDKEMIDFAVQSKAFSYLLKPYRDKEILATLQLASAKVKSRKILKIKQLDSSHIELVDGYIYNKSVKRLFLDGKEVKLGSKALECMQLLCENQHITVEIHTMIEELWSTTKSQQTLRSLVHRIRQATSCTLIENSNGFGYKIGLKK